MITIGNFFFKYRNQLFIFLYALLLIPSPELFTVEKFGQDYWFLSFYIGLFITTSGIVIRGLTIGLTFIERGGKDLKIHADALITRGLFTHCRNPLYVGNNLMLLGLGILSNSLIYVLVVVPVFLFIYQAIVLAEENFLKQKFGIAYEEYCANVNRWLPSMKGIGETFSTMKFNWVRWLFTEYNTQIFWLTGVFLTIIFKYPQVVGEGTEIRNKWTLIVLPVMVIYYLFLRWLRKSGKVEIN
jgi:protein-S-isoprenylcysteine O-methyltransferase Ste14